MSNIKKFIGEYAYKCIENSAYNTEALRAALVTPQNAREVFADLTEYDIKSLVSEISNSGTIGTVRQTTQEEIKKIFDEHGYTTVIFDDEQAIKDCAKYYRSNELICTYNSLRSRMREYHMLVAIRGDIDKIRRSENPQRDDEYGTSILNIQIARNGSHMSIKNRYNHTVCQCDSTYNNDLNHIAMGLQSMVLGYYGFAGLTNKSGNHYNNIVNIGGIYLKYHTEKNNIYFGAFVLDGIHGARYTDAGRYYVTRGNKKYYRSSPLVLDFHSKVAIDLIGDNGKTPLVSRAMREGVLNCNNKEKSETICAVFPDATKEILQANRKALKYAAEVYGYDFQKPYKITGILGKFTAKSIEKAIGSDSALLLLSDDGDIHAVELCHGKFQAKDLKRKYGYKIDTFCTQGNFENTRKSGETAVYVILQDKQYRRKIEKELGRTYTFRNGRMRYYDEMSDSELAQIQLQERLRAYKAKKRKAEVQATDYTSVISALNNEFTTMKTEIVSRLADADTYEEYDALTEVTNHRLSWLVRDIANIKTKASTNGFDSPQQAQDSINGAKATIAKMWNYLNEDDKTIETERKR